MSERKQTPDVLSDLLSTGSTPDAVVAPPAAAAAPRAVRKPAARKTTLRMYHKRGSQVRSAVAGKRDMIGLPQCLAHNRDLVHAEFLRNIDRIDGHAHDQAGLRGERAEVRMDFQIHVARSKQLFDVPRATR